jgi:hypothetical protein
VKSITSEKLHLAKTPPKTKYAEETQGCPLKRQSDEFIIQKMETAI